MDDENDIALGDENCDGLEVAEYGIAPIGSHTVMNIKSRPHLNDWDLLDWSEFKLELGIEVPLFPLNDVSCGIATVSWCIGKMAGTAGA